MVPSLPLWLKVPLIPRLLRAWAAWFAIRVESSMFSIRPAPRTGVGIRKMTLFVACAWAKLGCGSLQLPASDLPETVKRSSTPPFGALVFGLPNWSKKNGKRASRVGPLAVMNDGMALVEPLTMPLPITWNWGLFAGPVPPTAGCEWHPEHWLRLIRGPKPLLFVALPDTDSTSWKRTKPF